MAAASLTERREQAEALAVLERVQRGTGWRLGKVVGELRLAWGWEDRHLDDYDEDGGGQDDAGDGDAGTGTEAGTGVEAGPELGIRTRIGTGLGLGTGTEENRTQQRGTVPATAPGSNDNVQGGR